MRKNDKLLIIAVAFGAALVAFFVSNFVFGGAKLYNLKSPDPTAITDQFSQPNTAYFNKDAKNWTQDIVIGDTSNNKPFSN
jgi:hypothetical protein